MRHASGGGRRGGSPEIVTEPIAGTVVEAPDAAALAGAASDLLASPRERTAVRRYAERFGWDEVVRGQLALFRSALAEVAAR